MRKINNLDDAQIVINDLLNFKNRVENSATNNKGYQINNTAEGVAPGDVVTVSQISNLASKDDIPAFSQRTHYRTVLWSTQFSPVSGDTLPPYCITVSELAGTPLSIWAAAVTPGTTKSLKLNIAMLTRVSTADPDTGVITVSTSLLKILRSDLELPLGAFGPVRSSNFVNPVPNFGVNCFLVPVISQAGDQAAVSIGLVIRRNKKDVLV